VRLTYTLKLFGA